MAKSILNEVNPTIPTCYVVPEGVLQFIKNGPDNKPVGRNFIYSEIKAGRLKCRIMGRKKVCLASDITDYLENLPVYDPSGLGVSDE